MTVTPSGQTAYVNCEIDPAWVSDPARVFPVRVDPTVTLTYSGANFGDTYVSSATANRDTKYWSSTELHAGYSSASTGYNRTYVRFDTSSIPAAAFIPEATFKLHQSSGGANISYLGALRYSFSSGTTWNTQAGVVGNPEAKIYTSTVTTTSVAASSAEATWSIGPIVQQWLSGVIANQGVMVYQDESTTDSTHWRKFRSGEYSVTGDRPTLTVVYSQPGLSVRSSISGTAFHAGDSIVATSWVNTGWSACINAVKASVVGVGSGGSVTRGSFMWSKTPPEGGWVTTACAGNAGGYVSYDPAAEGADMVQLAPAECNTLLSDYDQNDNWLQMAWVFTLAPGWGDVQANDLQVTIFMDATDGNDTTSIWNSGPLTQETDFDVLPGSLASAPSAATTSSASWFAEPDADGDGMADAGNDSDTSGRGSAQLSWDADPNASAYNVYLTDGATYRKVGTTTGTTWSSAGARLYAGDSAIAQVSAATTSSLLPLQSPASAAREATVAVPGYAGAGAVVCDGSYLYVRAWSTYPGPTAWRKIGTGFGGTTAGSDYGSVGPDFSSQRILSAVLTGDKIYNGCAVTASSVTAVSKTTGSTTTLAFKTSSGSAQALLNRANGSDLTAPTHLTILAGDDAHFYSVSYGRGGTSLNGWTIREFTSAGTFVADHLIGSSSYYIDSALSDGTYLYFIQGGSNKVTQVRLSDWTVLDTWTPGWVSTHEISGCYDKANNLFWLGALNVGYVYQFSDGLDLRDDPTPLYAKVPGCAVADVPAYFFKVVPVNSAGEGAVSEAATVTVQLANRTVRANEDVARTVYDLGSVAGDAAECEITSGTLTLDATDLAIGSFGPAADLSRTYRSDVTSATLFASGWRFDFEQSISTGASSSRIYTDGEGVGHRFIPAGTNIWAAPHSMVATLSWAPASSTYTLVSKGGDTATFGSTGRLIAETDRHGQSATYSWSAPGVVITAANGHHIDVALSGNPAKATGAAYTAGGVTRQVNYDAAAATVTKHLNADEHLTVAYGYTSGRITEVSVPGFAPGGVAATWALAWSDSQLQSVHLPHPATIAERTVTFAIDAANRSATVSRKARVGVASADTTVCEIYRFDPTGRQTARGVPATTAASREGTDTTDYAPSGEARHSVTAAGVVTDSVTDARGNEIVSSDVDGHATTSVCNASDDVISSTDPKGSVTTYAYNAARDVTLERQTLGDGQNSETSSTYDAHGRLLSEGQLIDASGARVYTTYEYATAFDEPVRIVKHGVALSATNTVDLASAQALDAFGQSIVATDAAGTRVSASQFDLSGRLAAETDAAGAVTHHR
jgi:YD repeat-containing protein